MYFSSTLFVKKGKLADIWIAGTYRKSSKRLDKRKVLRIRLVEACEDIQHPPVRLALRSSAQLLVGCARVESLKVRFLWEDIRKTGTRLALHGIRRNVDLPAGRRRAAGKDISVPAPDAGLILLEPPLTDADFLAGLGSPSAVGAGGASVAGGGSVGGTPGSARGSSFLPGGGGSARRSLDLSRDLDLLDDVLLPFDGAMSPATGVSGVSGGGDAGAGLLMLDDDNGMLFLDDEALMPPPGGPEYGAAGSYADDGGGIELLPDDEDDRASLAVAAGGSPSSAPEHLATTPERHAPRPRGQRRRRRRRAAALEGEDEVTELTRSQQSEWIKNRADITLDCRPNKRARRDGDPDKGGRAAAPAAWLCPVPDAFAAALAAHMTAAPPRGAGRSGRRRHGQADVPSTPGAGSPAATSDDGWSNRSVEVARRATAGGRHSTVGGLGGLADALSLTGEDDGPLLDFGDDWLPGPGSDAGEFRAGSVAGSASPGAGTVASSRSGAGSAADFGSVASARRHRRRYRRDNAIDNRVSRTALLGHDLTQQDQRAGGGQADSDSELELDPDHMTQDFFTPNVGASAGPSQFEVPMRRQASVDAAAAARAAHRPAAGASSVTARTKKMRALLDGYITADDGSQRKTLDGMMRGTAAAGHRVGAGDVCGCFAELLVLATVGVVAVSQPRAFGSIRVRQGPRFREPWSTIIGV